MTDDFSEHVIDAALSSIWIRNRPAMLERVELLESAAAALAAAGTPDPALRREAAATAHMLAGSLGTFGLEGASGDARSAELLLDGELPLGAADADELRTLVRSIGRAVRATAPGAGRRIGRRLLLVDDDVAIRLVARMSLERIGGWRVADAPSGEAALALLDAGETFDAIVLDVTMPGLDGPATLELLRETDGGATAPVVFLTATVQPAALARLQALGAAGTIAKPFDPAALPAELERALSGGDDVSGAPAR